MAGVYWSSRHQPAADLHILVHLQHDPAGDGVHVRLDRPQARALDDVVPVYGSLRHSGRLLPRPGVVDPGAPFDRAPFDSIMYPRRCHSFA